MLYKYLIEYAICSVELVEMHLIWNFYLFFWIGFSSQYMCNPWNIDFSYYFTKCLETIFRVIFKRISQFIWIRSLNSLFQKEVFVEERWSHFGSYSSLFWLSKLLFWSSETVSSYFLWESCKICEWLWKEEVRFVDHLKK